MTAATRAPRPRRGRATGVGRIAALAVIALSLAGCASLPTSGPVEQGMTQAPTSGTIQYEASGPINGAGPTEIVEGFLQAGAAGLSGENDFGVARAFLTNEASSSWLPLAQVLVSANESPQVPVMTLPERPDEAAPGGTAPPQELDQQDADDLDRLQVRLGVVAVADVDSAGIYTAAASQAASELTYGLARVDGEWRIDSLPSGLLLSEVAFGNVFRQVPVMFLSRDLTTLVPDVRFVPTRNAPSHALDHLLAGPAPWLSSAVTTRVASGMTLEQPGAGVVVGAGVDGGQAEVRLAGGGAMTDDDRALLFTQVSQTLLAVPGTQSVALWIGGDLYEPATDAPAPGPPPPPRGPITALSEGSLVTVDSDGITPYAVAGTADPDPSGTADPADPAPSGTDDPASTGTDTPAPSGTPAPPPSTDPPDGPVPALSDLRRPAPAYDPDDGVAVLQGQTRLLHVAPDGTPTLLHSGTDLLAPTQDRFGWVVTGEQENPGSLAAIAPDGTQVTVEAEHLAGRVLQIRVSADGARVAVMTETDGVATVSVSALVRDSDGAPARLLPGPVLLGDLASGLGMVWTSGTGLAVLGSLETAAVPSVRSVLVSGPAENVATTTQAVSIASGRELYLATAENRLLVKVSLRWEEVASPVTDPAFPG